MVIVMVKVPTVMVMVMLKVPTKVAVTRKAALLCGTKHSQGYGWVRVRTPVR